MRETTIRLTVAMCKADELSAPDRELCEAAVAATSRAYAPYSHFSVGAAIRLEGGVIVTGANQENVAFPSGTCAERSACFYAHAAYPDLKFEAIAIAARGTDGALTPPQRRPAVPAVRLCSNMRCLPATR